MNFVAVSRRTLIFLLTLAVSVLLVASIACGDDDDNTGDDAATIAVGTGTGDGGGETSFDVTMTDNAFAQTNLTVSTGAAITLSLTNDGAAIHNMRIAGEDGEFDTDDDGVSDPDMLRAGETGALEWTAPGEAGDYDFPV